MLTGGTWSSIVRSVYVPDSTELGFVVSWHALALIVRAAAKASMRIRFIRFSPGEPAAARGSAHWADRWCCCYDRDDNDYLMSRIGSLLGDNNARPHPASG